jgi:hypothetical protein
LVGCSELRIAEDARECVLGRRRLREGDMITIDGEAGDLRRRRCCDNRRSRRRPGDRAAVAEAQADAIGASFPPMGGDLRR